MSTRGAIGIRYDGQDKLVYNHSDSYPEGVGEDIFAGIKNAVLLNQKNGGTLDGLVGIWRQQALAARLIDHPIDDPLVPQGRLLSLLEIGIFPDANGFILNSLFCEWAYILNLDTLELEIYKGFQHQPHEFGRYAKITTMVEDYERRNAERRAKYEAAGKSLSSEAQYIYYPCALIASFPIREIPEHSSLCDWLETVGAISKDSD